MTTVTFNTHKFIRKLETAGFDTRQAEAMTEALAEVPDESTAATLASKQDFHALKEDINVLRLEMREIRLNLIKWMTGALIAQATVVILIYIDSLSK